MTARAKEDARPPCQAPIGPLALLLTLFLSACGNSSHDESSEAIAPSFHSIPPIPEHLARIGAGSEAVAQAFVEVVGDGKVAYGTSHLSAPRPDGSSEEIDAVFRWTEGTGSVALGDLPVVYPEAVTGFQTLITAANPSGSVLVGTTAGGRAFRWTESDGMVDISPADARSGAYALLVSDDGSVVAGHAGGQLFRWTNRTGTVPFALPPGYSYAIPGAMSRDGRVVVGLIAVGDGLGNDVPFRWTEPTGVAIAEPIADCSSYRRALAYSVSYGAVMAGTCTSASGGQQAFIWSESTGFVGLGVTSILPNPEPYAVSSDGSVVVGLSGGLDTVFRWTRASGTSEILAVPADYTTASLERWGMSADGSVVVTNATNGGLRWSRQSGASALEPLPTHDQTSVSGVSGDGRIIAGSSSGAGLPIEPVVWMSDGHPLSVVDLLLSNHLEPIGVTTFASVQAGRSGRLLYGEGIATVHETVGWVAWLPP